MAELLKWQVETFDKKNQREWLDVEAHSAERARDLAQSEGDVDRVGRIRRA